MGQGCQALKYLKRKDRLKARLRRHSFTNFREVRVLQIGIVEKEGCAIPAARKRRTLPTNHRKRSASEAENSSPVSNRQGVTKIEGPSAASPKSAPLPRATHRTPASTTLQPVAAPESIDS